MDNCISDQDLQDLLICDPASQKHIAHLQDCEQCKERFQNLVPAVPEELSSHINMPSRDRPTDVDLPSNWQATLAQVISFPQCLRQQNARFSDSAQESTEHLAAAQSEPSQMGPFEIFSKIGAGGMGVVFKAYDQTVHRTVAIKVLAPRFATSFDELIRREAIICAQIEHPNVIPIYSVDTFYGQACLVMQYVDGPSLAELMDNDDRMNAHQIAEIVSQVAEGVSAAHDLGILHRDIKPGNILINQKTGIAKIGDFGLAALCSQEEISNKSGTPQFMSPECVAGGRPSKKSDIYSLGITLIHALTTALPSDSSAHLTHQTIDHDLLAIVEKATDKDVENRYDNMSTFAQDLKAWQKDEPITAKPQTVTKTMFRQIKRHKLAFVSIGVLLIVVVGAVWQIGRSQRQYTQQLQKKHRTQLLSKAIQDLQDVWDHHNSPFQFKLRPASGKNILVAESRRDSKTAMLRMDSWIRLCDEHAESNMNGFPEQEDDLGHRFGPIYSWRFFEHWTREWVALGKADLAMKYLERWCQVCEQLNDADHCSKIQISLASLWFDQSDLYLQQQNYLKYRECRNRGSEWLARIAPEGRSVLRFHQYEMIQLKILDSLGESHLGNYDAAVKLLTSVRADIETFESTHKRHHDCKRDCLKINIQLSHACWLARDHQRSEKALEKAYEYQFLQPRKLNQATELWIQAAKKYLDLGANDLADRACEIGRKNSRILLEGLSGDPN